MRVPSARRSWRLVVGWPSSAPSQGTSRLSGGGADVDASAAASPEAALSSSAAHGPHRARMSGTRILGRRC